VGQGVQESINDQFKAIGSDLIMVTPGAGGGFSAFGPSSGAKLTQHDIDIIKKLRGVNLVGGIVAKYARVEYGGESKYSLVIGLPTDESQKIILNMQQVVFESGQERFKKDEKYDVVIGYAMAHDNFFKSNVGLRNKLKINGKDFEVISIIESLGNPADDQQIYVPIHIAEEIFNETDNYYSIIVSVDQGFNPSEVADRITKKLRDDRGLAKGEEDFSVQTYDQLLTTINSVLGVMQVVLLGIAAISLLVGGVGIMNSMYTSVIERTNEIGIMKAIGARNSDILIIFLFEAGILGLLGGIVGCVLGIGLAQLIQFSAATAGFGFLKVFISPLLIAGTLLFSFTFGLIAGFLPAVRALKLKIVDALHYE
jgi:putative ABC transport system permease protein